MRTVVLIDPVPYLSSLSSLLCRCVREDASIGFLPPLPSEKADAYWQDVATDVHQGKRLLLAVVADNQVLGCVQLSLCDKDNAGHRAEVEKLMVCPSQRGQGLGKALMQKLELCALEHARSLLVLDTRLGDVASQLYQRMGYIEAGSIPQFASNADGGLDATVYFYKLIGKTA